MLSVSASGILVTNIKLFEKEHCF